jgi:hypothetical protein
VKVRGQRAWGQEFWEKLRGPDACVGASVDSQVSWVSATNG